MNIVKLLLDNEDSLFMSMNPGCYFENGKYSFGICGFQGYNSGDTKQVAVPNLARSQQTIPELEKPRAVGFRISVLDEDLYNQLRESLDQYDDIFKTCTPRRELPRQMQLKAEHKEHYDALKKKEQEVFNRCKSLVQEIKSLGCYIDENSVYPLLTKVPEDWYAAIGEKNYVAANIEIGCHAETEVYKALEESGLLDQYAPKWYLDALSNNN